MMLDTISRPKTRGAQDVKQKGPEDGRGPKRGLQNGDVKLKLGGEKKT